MSKRKINKTDLKAVHHVAMMKMNGVLRGYNAPSTVHSIITKSPIGRRLTLTFVLDEYYIKAYDLGPNFKPGQIIELHCKTKIKVRKAKTIDLQATNNTAN